MVQWKQGIAWIIMFTCFGTTKELSTCKAASVSKIPQTEHYLDRLLVDCEQ